MTLIRKSSEDYIKDAKKILEDGGLVVFPTETVYGLGADALNEKACKKIYIAKGRPSDNPLIIHIGNIAQLEKIVEDIPDDAKKLMDIFWPGPLTLIFKKSNLVSNIVTGGLDTVAVRMPNHDTALNLLKNTSIPIAAPSANISGKPSPTKAEHVIYDLENKVDLIIVDDNINIGIESTILDLTQDIPIILRPGFITKQMIEDVLQKEVMYDLGDSKNPKAPGMKYKHYAPDAKLIILQGDIENIKRFIKKNADESTVLIALESDLLQIVDDKKIYKTLSYGKNLEDACRNMYTLFRKCNEIGAKKIYALGFERHERGYSIMNRLDKASGYRVERISEEK